MMEQAPSNRPITTLDSEFGPNMGNTPVKHVELSRRLWQNQYKLDHGQNIWTFTVFLQYNSKPQVNEN